MMLHFNVTGSRRKELVKAIEEKLGIKAKYLGVPTAAYEVDGYNISKDGCLSWADLDDADPAHIDKTNDLVNALIAAGFEAPDEWKFYEEQEKAMETQTESPITNLTVEIPRDQFTDTQLEHLQSLIKAKAPLLKEALAVDELPLVITDEKVSFPWFKKDIDNDSCLAYTRLVTALYQMAKDAKRVTAKEKEVENSKYAFRCFLLRLGFIGDEYKKSRKILLKNFTGSSAFKNGMKKGGER